MVKALKERLVPLHGSYRPEVASWLQEVADEEECTIQQVQRKIIGEAYKKAKGLTNPNGAHKHDKAARA